jgi:hypothetical protein
MLTLKLLQNIRDWYIARNQFSIGSGCRHGRQDPVTENLIRDGILLQ